MTRSIVAAVLIIAALPMAAWGQDAKDLKVTPQIERAVQRGLAYLHRTQKPDGSWPGNYGSGSGVVGLCMMTFLAHGEMPDEGKYGKTIRKAVEYIVKHQKSNGLLDGRGGSPMYNHGFATLALAEVYGMIDYPKLGPALKKATGLIVKAQNSTGGWRYSVNSTDGDTTVSGAQMMALRAAANAGIEVPYSCVQRGVGFYKRCFCEGGGFGYTNAGGPGLPRAGIGLLVMSLSGAYRSPETKATADWIMNNMTQQRGGHFYYACYYTSQGMFQAGGKYWRQWNDVMNARLVSTQRANGSWTGGMGRGGGALDTAFAMLSFEINYNFLPIYQR
jgi:hypothetical protein